MVKPRILMVVRPTEGGIRAHVLNLLCAMQDQFHFTVACPPGQSAAFREAGCDAVPVLISGKPHPYHDLAAMRRICREIKEREIALVHAHGFKAALLARPAARWVKTPCLVTVHGNLVHAGSTAAGRIFRAAERYLAGWATGYVTVSAWLAGVLSADFGIPEHKIKIIPNGVDFPGDDEVSGGLLPFEAGTVLVGTVARLAPQKGLDSFVRAAGRLAPVLPHIRFIIVGDGPLRPELERLCSELGINESVYFTGFRHDIFALLKRFDVYVQPSLSEGQGITVLEAMAAGCPVVASDTGGLRELVQDGETGLLVPPGHAAGLADAVALLLNNQPLREKVAAQAKKVVRKYGKKRMICETAEVYRNVLEGRWPA